MALQDEKNPFSRQLILENYVYAKAYACHQFDDAILFFESQAKNSISDETKRLLAEMYYEGGYYEKCIKLSDEMIGIFKSKQKIYDLVALLLCRAKSETFIKKMNMLEKGKNILQLAYYKQIPESVNFIRK